MRRILGRTLVALSAASLLECGQSGPPRESYNRARSGGDPISIYRLRVEFETTSDWSSLEISDDLDILTFRLVQTEGDPTHADVTARTVRLNQSLDRARQERSVGVTVDFAITSESAELPTLRLLLKKGALNSSYVRLSIVEGDRIHVLDSYRLQGSLEEDPGTNAVALDVDLAALRSMRAQRMPLVKSRAFGRMLWAFYYPWYRHESWHRPSMTELPVIPYSSDDRKVIIDHVRKARETGIDGFIVSWSGPGSYSDRNMKTLLEVAGQQRFAICIYFETLTDTGPLEQWEIEKWLEYAISTYREDPAYMKIGGKPVIVIWASREVPRSSWEDVFSHLRSKGFPAFYIGMSYDVTDLAVFDGLHQYGIFTIRDLETTLQQTSMAVKQYSIFGDTTEQKLFAATVQPGYDERRIPGRKGLYQDRNNGDFYRKTFDAAIASDPDWIFITSWNEWFENTQIEPARSYGDKYLRMTAEYARRWKGRTQNR